MTQIFHNWIELIWISIKQWKAQNCRQIPTKHFHFLLFSIKEEQHKDRRDYENTRPNCFKQKKKKIPLHKIAPNLSMSNFFFVSVVAINYYLKMKFQIKETLVIFPFCLYTTLELLQAYNFLYCLQTTLLYTKWFRHKCDYSIERPNLEWICTIESFWCKDRVC